MRFDKDSKWAGIKDILWWSNCKMGATGCLFTLFFFPCSSRHWLWVPPGQHMLLACSVCVPSACFLISSPAIRLLCVLACRCAGVFILECVSHTSCTPPLKAKLYGTAGPPFILNSLFLFLFRSLSCVALLIGRAFCVMRGLAWMDATLELIYQGTTVAFQIEQEDLFIWHM